MNTSSTDTRPAPWWRTAPNPPCVPWCEDTHAADEFTYGGGFLCSKVIRKTEAFEVEVQAYIGTNVAEDDYQAEPATVRIELLRDMDAMLPEDARTFARELALAISEAATVAERTVRA